jgi:glycosyltransferase involved in cell wall biosynthesis
VIDFSKWAVVGYNDDTGIGRMAADARKVLGVGRHLVIPSERLANKTLGSNEVVLNSRSSVSDCAEALENIEGLLFFERPSWIQELLPTARKMDVRTVCVPMWEWFWPEDPLWRYCDFFACPNQQAFRILRQHGYSNSAYVPWALDLESLPKREIRGVAKTFVHNAGLVDRDDRKGTRDTIEAFSSVKNPELRLIVRIQKEALIGKVSDSRIELRVGNVERHGDLYAEGDVAIQPSKMEGIGFMVLEAICAGLPAITLDYPPMNEYGTEQELRVKTRWFSRKAFASQWIPHAHLRLPRISDLRKKIQWCAGNDLAGISQRNRAWADLNYAPGTIREQWQQALRRAGIWRQNAALAAEVAA